MQSKVILGKIIKGIAGFYYVHIPDKGIYECKAKGVFRKNNEKPLVGDNVEIIGELIHPIAMDKGLKFAIREGGRTIASGQVTEISE